MDAQPETPPPIEEKHSFRWRGFILWPLVLLVFYILSYGPVLKQSHQFVKNPWDNEEVRRFYKPVLWLYDWTPFHKPLGLYFHFWKPDMFDKYGNETAISMFEMYH